MTHHVLHHACGVRWIGATYPSKGLLVARVVRLSLRGLARCRAGAVAHCLSYALEVGDRDKAAGAVQRVASFVPVWVVLAVDDVQEVALGKAELVRVGRLVIVESLYDL